MLLCKMQLLTSITQLEETLGVVKGQRKEVEDELNRWEINYLQYIVCLTKS